MPSIPKSNRFNAWFMTMLFTAVALGAVVDNSNKVNSRVNEDWIISACAITLSFSAIMVITHFAGDLSTMCIGNKPEGAMAFICAALWCAATATIMRPKNNLAVTGPVIVNANLYFFTWGALVAIIYILGSYLTETRTIDAGAIRNSVSSTPRLFYWLALITASTIVFATAADQHGLVCSENRSSVAFENPCSKNSYAISYGVIGCFFSIIAALGTVTNKVSLTIEALISTMLFIFYCVGAAVVTGVGGPGEFVGNLYFATWSGFLLTISLSISSIKEIMAGRNAGGDEGTSRDAPEPEAPVEAEDDV
eukprot:CAMPEP_0185723566 /NCGR_PEP_ID=MMETSP1171-20130828/368_1 /TAXON_ID=374046 /ORGANISM="Helicotheca tamensis, Strain CCMP826" /LENGTH=307 /DNA_ID=CAMNT_0028391287 /DNA_START=117 /DNA_END=1040 /DNA_ORIENTATION=+